MLQQNNSKNVIIFLIDRLKSHYQLHTDLQLADKLGVKPNTLAMWKSRNTIDYDLLFTKCDDLDFHWLITGDVLNRSNITCDSNKCKSCADKDERIAELKDHIATLKEQVTRLERGSATKNPPYSQTA